MIQLNSYSQTFTQSLTIQAMNFYSWDGCFEAQKFHSGFYIFTINYILRSYLFLYVHVPKCMYVYHMDTGTRRGQKRVLYLQKLELQMDVNCHGGAGN